MLSYKKYKENKRLNTDISKARNNREGVTKVGGKRDTGSRHW